MESTVTPFPGLWGIPAQLVEKPPFVFSGFLLREGLFVTPQKSGARLSGLLIFHILSQRILAKLRCPSRKQLSYFAAVFFCLLSVEMPSMARTTARTTNSTPRMAWT